MAGEVPRVWGSRGEVHDKHHERAESHTAVRADTAAPTFGSTACGSRNVSNRAVRDTAVREQAVREPSSGSRTGRAGPTPSGNETAASLRRGSWRASSRSAVAFPGPAPASDHRPARSGRPNRVTLISGPPGGKTVACRHLGRGARAGPPVVWLTLDAEDQQSWFWAHVCAGCPAAVPFRPNPSGRWKTYRRTVFRCGCEAAQTFTEPVILVLMTSTS